MNIKEIVNKQSEFFKTGNTLKVEERINSLKLLRKQILKNQDNLLESLKADLGKCNVEAYMTELGLVVRELNHTIKNLNNWSKPKRKRTDISQIPAKCFEYYEPYGVVLIIAPWNYPLMLTIVPLIGAIAAGNCCIIKTSNKSKNTSKAVANMLGEVFKSEYIAVVEGGKEENILLLEQKFDYIFFTGSREVGKIVMEKAAKYLTPVTLELGGKSPCIVEKTANLSLAAKRIVFGKILNSGQTCVAPDYVLVEESITDKFIEELKFWVKKMIGDDPISNPNYPNMINQESFHRVVGLINTDKVVFGGKSDLESLKIEPTILKDITSNDAVMQQEIFGPVLPLIEFKTIKQVKTFISSKDKPLALYLFTKNKKIAQNILESISFGGGCVNDTILHMTSPYMKFGGVGASGMGSYHGKNTFDTFSHSKSVIVQSNFLDMPLRYQPYTKKSELIIRKIMR